MLTACKGLPPLTRLRSTQVSTGITKKEGRQFSTNAPTRTMPGKGSLVLQLAFQHCQVQLFCPLGRAVRCKAQVLFLQGCAVQSGHKKRQVSTARETFKYARLEKLLVCASGCQSRESAKSRLREAVTHSL